jgi:hypothetical protein
MASGKLGNGNTVSNTWHSAYQVPSSKIASFSVTVVNKTGGNALVDIAISSTTTPGGGEFIESGVVAIPAGVVERTGLVASASEYLMVRSDVTGLDFRVMGYEENP